jgi:hypothetical protein
MAVIEQLGDRELPNSPTAAGHKNAHEIVPSAWIKPFINTPVSITGLV